VLPFYTPYSLVKVKQTWRDPEDSMRLRFPDYMTMAQDGGKVVSHTHRPPLHPGNRSNFQKLFLDDLRFNLNKDMYKVIMGAFG